MRSEAKELIVALDGVEIDQLAETAEIDASQQLADRVLAILTKTDPQRNPWTTSVGPFCVPAAVTAYVTDAARAPVSANRASMPCGS